MGGVTDAHCVRLCVPAAVYAHCVTLWSVPLPQDVTLNHRTLSAIVDKPDYYGVTVGRFANRIKGAKFSIDGVVSRLVD